MDGETDEGTEETVETVGSDGPTKGGTRWLDADEQATWRAFMLASKLLFEQFERELPAALEPACQPQYYEVLVRLSESPERSMRMSELANLSQSSRSRLSHAVARLEDAGWVRRRSCPGDRRGTTAVLTNEGMAVLEAAAPAHVESVRTHLFDQLSPQQLRQLRAISDDLLNHLAALGISCGGLVACGPDSSACDPAEESSAPLAAGD